MKQSEKYYTIPPIDRFQELKTQYSIKYSRLLILLGLGSLLSLIRILREYKIITLLYELIISMRRFLKYLNSKENIGILVESLDKGGLEQVVYNLVLNSKRVNIIVFVVGSEIGTIGYTLRKKGYAVFLLNKDFEKFEKVVKRKGIRKLNSHFSIWELDKIKNLGIEIIYTIHSQYVWITERLEISKRKEMYKYVDKFIAVSEVVKNYFIKKFDIKSKDIEVISNGLDTNEFQGYEKAKKLKEENKFVFLNVASFVPIKNHFLMISALSELKKKNKNVELWFVGNVVFEEYKNRLDKAIEELGLERDVKIFDFMNKKELANLYDSADCFLLPSLYEGCPNVLLEAMYFSLPIISTNVGNAKELLNDVGIVIKNSYSDLLEIEKTNLDKILYSLDQKNKKELIDAMLVVINEYSVFKEKAKQGSNIIKNHYNIKNMVTRYEDIYLSE